MSAVSVFGSREDFTAICNLSSKALKKIDKRSWECAIMRAFLSINSQMGERGASFEKVVSRGLYSHSKTGIKAVVYKLLHKTEPLDDLRSRLEDVEKKIKSYSATEVMRVVDRSDPEERGAFKVSAHEVLSRFFLGNIRAAASGIVPSGEHEDQPYGLMVKVTPDSVELNPDIDVLDISVDDSDFAWADLVEKASGGVFSLEMPAKTWFKMTFDQIAISLLEGENVLLFCSYGVSRSATVAIAFLMRLFGATFSQAASYLRNIRTMIAPADGFLKNLRIYDELLQNPTRVLILPQIYPFKIESMEELKKMFDGCMDSMCAYIAQELEVAKGVDAAAKSVAGISLNEILPRLFWGNGKAAESGTILFGRRKGQPYGLVVNFSTEPMTFKACPNVLNIGIDDSPHAWDDLILKTSGISSFLEMPVEEWFKGTFDDIAGSLLKNENVLVCCSDGCSCSSIIAMAFLMRLFRMRASCANSYIEDIRPVVSYNSGLRAGLQNYDALLYQFGKTVVPQNKSCIML